MEFMGRLNGCPEWLLGGPGGVVEGLPVPEALLMGFLSLSKGCNLGQYPLPYSFGGEIVFDQLFFRRGASGSRGRDQSREGGGEDAGRGIWLVIVVDGVDNIVFDQLFFRRGASGSRGRDQSREGGGEDAGRGIWLVIVVDGV